MESVIEYALAHAPTDVAETIQWALDEGFQLRRQYGGESTGFGDVRLEFDRAGVGTAFTRDRDQWMMALAAPGDSKWRGLDVLLTAREGGQPNLEPRRASRYPRATQLPDGVLWRKEVPVLVEWITSADRTADIAAAAQQWGQTMTRRLGLPTESDHRED